MRETEAALTSEQINQFARQAGLPMSWLDEGKASAWPELERFARLVEARIAPRLSEKDTQSSDTIDAALAAPGCERLRDFYAVGPLSMIGGKDKTRIRNTTPDEFRAQLAQGKDRSVNTEAQETCSAQGEPEEGIELRCCLPAGHEGQHSFLIVPAHGVGGSRG
jgi:hypothetical protein